jgi:hypothetical protein
VTPQPLKIMTPMNLDPSGAQTRTPGAGEEPPPQRSGRSARVEVPRAVRREIAGSNRSKRLRDKAWSGAIIAGIPTWFLSFGISGRLNASAAAAAALATIVTAVMVCLVFFVALAVLQAWKE